jgi:hypothetical protein
VLRRRPEDEALVLACARDVKTRYRVHPERVVAAAAPRR